MIIKVSDYERHGIKIVPNPDNDSQGVTQLQDNKEQICYDLHVGKSIKLPGDDTRRPAPKTIILRPNDCIRIETREHIAVPDNVFGELFSRASLTAEGLLVSNCKVDPKFYGKLVIAVSNTSRNRITIDSKLPFCSLVFHLLESAVSAVTPPRTPPEPKIISGNRAIEYLISILPYILTFIASVAASLIAAYLFGWLSSK